jgi:hypothetical protein
LDKKTAAGILAGAIMNAAYFSSKKKKDVMVSL